MNFTESETVELKLQVTADLCKEVVAFANTRGGTLYIGVENDGAVAGLQDPDAAILQLNNMIRDSIRPDVTRFVRYQVLEQQDRQLLAVTVQKGTGRPYYLAAKGLKPCGVFVRSGTAADPATEAAIRAMIKETDGDSYESARSLEQELTFRAAEQHFEQRGLAFDRAKMQTLGLRDPEGVWSNLALLLSDQCPATVKAATFGGTDQGDFRDRREFSGSLLQQMEQLYAYLDLRNQTRATFQGLYRTDLRDYPEEALREALLNCLVHRDYSYSASTLVSVYRDRIELVSVGGLLPGIALEDVLLGLSVCRNPKLAGVFYRLELIEAYGTGMKKILQAYQGTGLTPRVEATANAFKITLLNRNGAGAQPAGDDRQQQVLALLQQQEHVTRSQVETLLGVSQATANRLLTKMADQGLLRREGGGRTLRYRRR